MDEPFTNLLTQGMVIKDGAKMSKSKGNVVDPNDLIEQYGADTVRLFSLLPHHRSVTWNGMPRVWKEPRFLYRVYRLVTQNLACFEQPCAVQLDALNEPSRALYRKTHQTIRRVTESIESNFHFNTAISGVMELVNLATTATSEPIDGGVQRRLWRPSSPCSSPWSLISAKSCGPSPAASSNSTMPLALPYNKEAAKEEELTIVVQINGKVRTSTGADEHRKPGVRAIGPGR